MDISKWLAHFVYFIFYSLGFIVYLLPFKIKYILAKFWAFIWFYIIKIRVKVQLHNLTIAFPKNKHETISQYKNRIYKLAKENLVHTVLALYEILQSAHWKLSDVEKQAKIIGLEYHDSNKGVFYLVSHIGCFEMSGKITSLSGMKGAFLARRARSKFFEIIIKKFRLNLGHEVIAERGTYQLIQQYIKDKRSVAFMFDQHLGEPIGTDSKFFDQKVMSAKGLATLSEKLSTPIHPMSYYRSKKGIYEVTIHPAIDFQFEDKYCAKTNKLRDEYLYYHTSKCNEIIEGWVRENPTQYFWLHRRFKLTHNYRELLPWQK